MTSFTLPDTHVHLGADGTAELLDGTELWSRGPAELDDALPHWLVAAFALTAQESPGSAERHPNGDELLCASVGSLDVFLDDPGAPRVVRLHAGQTFLVPRGTWHRLQGREPGLLITITWGRGTEHG